MITKKTKYITLISNSFSSNQKPKPISKSITSLLSQTKSKLKLNFKLFNFPNKNFCFKKSIYPNKKNTKKLYNTNNNNDNNINNYNNSNEEVQITENKNPQTFTTNDFNNSNDIIQITEDSIIYSTHPDLDHIDNSDPLSEYNKSLEGEEFIFQIAGQENQIAIIDIYPGKKIKSESAKIMYMTDGVDMTTSASGGFTSAFKRLFTGGTILMTEFSFNFSKGFGRVGFGEPFPSKILPIRLNNIGGEIICQKGAFICGSPDIEIEVFRTNLKTAIFGGEGLFLQKIMGNGTCLIKAGGSIIKRTLREKEKLKIRPGLIIAFETSVNYTIEYIGGVNMFGTGSIFFATLTGPGNIYIQTMDFDNMVDEIIKRIPSRRSTSSSRRRSDEAKEDNENKEGEEGEGNGEDENNYNSNESENNDNSEENK
jgi:uncharacterized protein (TIGR00266 family)